MALEPEGSRRILKSRDTAWAQTLARRVAAAGITPNTISVLSIVFAVAGAACLVEAADHCCGWPASVLYLGGAAGIQLRLLCNLIDGMVAIEGGQKSAVGALYNEVPDRIADSVLLIAAGCSLGASETLVGIPLGWLAALLAMLTAYIRVLGGTLTGTQSFIGPMAKQHRMFVLTLACVGSFLEPWLRPTVPGTGLVMPIALTVIVIGSALTCWRRLALIATQLRAR